ncbi:MAG: translocation/assembly module TamB domain-containing protein [Chitinophagales bacterium]|nr:translocation/assembly module TamB domain-containing protein [Chitinophagaceae bacterium]MCB9064323.1 translocation/assembly module TamB domain-containing protein [Chitinophagales bacterium]
MNTKVELKYVKLSLLNEIQLKELYIQDNNNDTLLYAGEASVRITDWFILKNGAPVLKYVGLKNAFANLYRKKDSEEWNYQFVIDAFDSGPKEDSTPPAAIDIDLKKVALENVRFHMNDAWVGSDMNFNVGSFLIDADKIDLEKKIIDIDEIAATETQVILRDYDGGRPPKPKTPRVNTIDTTAFNPDNWAINLSKLKLKNCLFRMDVGTKAPYYMEFDPDHMNITDVNIDARDLEITGDTLTAKLKMLSANERCGIAIKKMEADITVSPNESTCENLTLETNNSKITDHYSMHYERFPDFNDYLEKVVMVANFKNTKLDSRDIAYFAPVLRDYPTVLTLNGKVKGTVTDIQARNLNINDGLTTIKGDLTMKGLPDIYETNITYTEGELFTSGQGIIKYAPTLKTDSSIAIGAITHAYFKGDFIGYINNFALNGTITSNIGSIASDVTMILPETKDGIPQYTGKIAATDLNLGVLLKESELGMLSLTANVKGTANKLNEANIEFKTIIERIDYKGYTYQGINADGNFTGQKFDGNLLIDDPNISMGFYGLFDFSKEKLKINAKANLLHSDLTALKLVVDEQTTLSADFDLDWEGNSLDTFTGVARLYNIDLRRSEHRLDLDSVYVRSTDNNGKKKLQLESNAISAKLEGVYSLEELPGSFQYYMAGYLPNYINKPAGIAPNQNFSFHIKTRELDSIFALLMPQLSGFDNASIDGSLNTGTQRMELNATIPKGKYNNIELKEVGLTAHGNFETLAISAGSEKIIFGDTATYGSLSITTTLGNDKLDFTVATSSPNAFSTALIEGEAHTHGDTLDLKFLESEFYVNEKHWKIPANNRITYTDGYISIINLTIQSGSEKIHVNSENSTFQQDIGITLSNLNIGEIGSLAGFGGYEPHGILNGKINLVNPFNHLSVVTDLWATGVTFGKDTIGKVMIAGEYDGKNHLVNLAPRTGIYQGDKSLTVKGHISLDSANTEKLDGKISFKRAPMHWLAPVLAGFVSDISGSLNGEIDIRGTSTDPDIAGGVTMNDIGMRIDFLGTKYRIPTGRIDVNNKAIDLGQLTLYDQFDNTATILGGISHNRFKNMRLGITMHSKQFQVINLKRNESDIFYGNLVAKFQSMSVSGPFDDVLINIVKAEPASESHLFLPIGAGEEMSTYSYITFKNYGEEKEEVKKDNSKLTIKIDANMNPLATITLIMDPSTGDAINASGTGNILMEIPPNNDISMHGNFKIDDGDYTFTLKQLFFKRKFILNKGSTINFTGPIDDTRLGVEGIYRTRARLYDLLKPEEKNLLEGLTREKEEATMTRAIDVIMHMGGTLATPKLSFEIEIPNNTASGTIAYKKLESVNQNERDLFNQVASLLLINSFISTESGFEAGAGTGVVNNISDIFSGTASTQLTNLLGKLTGDENLAVDFKYQQYNSTTGASSESSVHRNEVSLGLKKKLLEDRLSIEVGSSLDWGKPTADRSGSNFNPVGDFRVQYQIQEGGNLRANLFRTSSYDVVAGQNIARGGVGLSYSKSFNTFGELFRGRKYQLRKEEEEEAETEERIKKNQAETDSK